MGHEIGVEATYKYCQNHMPIFMPVLSCIHTEIHTLTHNFTNHFRLRTFRMKGTAVRRLRGEGTLGSGDWRDFGVWPALKGGVRWERHSWECSGMKPERCLAVRSWSIMC